jgi:hypothetical protein
VAAAFRFVVRHFGFHIYSRALKNKLTAFGDFVKNTVSSKRQFRQKDGFVKKAISLKNDFAKIAIFAYLFWPLNFPKKFRPKISRFF